MAADSSVAAPDTAQITYEIIRPVVLWGQTPKERGEETGMSARTIYYCESPQIFKIASNF